MKTIDEVLFHALYEIVLGTADPEAAIRYLKDQLGKAGYEIKEKRQCVFEARSSDGSGVHPMAAYARAWCQTHGFDCPELLKTAESNPL